LLRLPDLLRRVDDTFPAKGGAPEPPPVPEVELIVGPNARKRGGWPGYLLAGGLGAAALYGTMALGWIG
jgi:ubiquinone biosynthesis protein